MTQNTRPLERKIKALEDEVRLLKGRLHKERQIYAEVRELRKFFDDLKLFMLRLLQGYVPLEVVYEHIGHKVAGRTDLRLLHDAAVKGRWQVSKKALIIIYHLYGINDRKIMDFLNIARNTVKRNVKKYRDIGIKQFLDTQHKGLKIIDNPEIKEKLISILHSPPREHGYNRTAWTLKLLGLELRKQGFPVSRNNVSKIINKAGYRFWKAKEVLTSNDPLYREKLEAIREILSNLKADERFFSIDEFGPFAVKERGGRRLVRQGEYPTVAQFQKSKGSIILTGALELFTNQMTHFYSDKKNSAEIVKMLHILTRKYAGCQTIYLSWDHASWHTSKAVFAEIDKVNESQFRKGENTPVVKVSPLPSRAQFLNVIESVFSGMAAAIIENSNYDSVEEAKGAIDLYFAERNKYFIENPKRAGKKIWGKELVAPVFKEGQNCKNRRWR